MQILHRGRPVVQPDVETGRGDPAFDLIGDREESSSDGSFKLLNGGADRQRRAAEYTTGGRWRGRVERRKYIVLYDLSLIRGLPLWARLAAIGRCVYEREAEGKLGSQEHYFIGSRRMDARALRAQLGIENSQSDDPQCAGLCATGESGYHRPGSPFGASGPSRGP
ncbi:MAG: hypothetical protein ACRC33_14055 [Gemmataceae bacterium]